METSITRRASRFVSTLAVLSALGGCAVYDSPPVYYGGNGVGYASPAPVYVAPPVYTGPRYVGPPVYLNFGFGSWGGRSYYRGGHRGHGGWHGGRGRGYRR